MMAARPTIVAPMTKPGLRSSASAARGRHHRGAHAVRSTQVEHGVQQVGQRVSPTF